MRKMEPDMFVAEVYKRMGIDGREMRRPCYGISWFKISSCNS